MTDQQTQRYRPLAVGEVREKGDEFWNVKEERWELTYCVGVAVLFNHCRRPIPETNWREPVGDAGYPYPQGTVVQTIGKVDQSIIETVILPDDSTMTLHDNQVYVRSHFGSKCKHRVIDYRPDLLDRQPKPKKLESCTCYINVGRCPQHGGAKQPEPAPAESAELTRMRAEVERLTKSNQNWERLSFASANTADAARDEIEKLRAEVERYKTSAENIRDFADLFKQERDEARAEVDRLTAKLAKYQPSEYQSIDLTESTVFVGAAWGEGKGEI